MSTTLETPPIGISLEGLDLAEVLRDLYNASSPVGIGKLVPFSDVQMTVEEARVILETAKELYPRPNEGPSYSFDYVRGRPVKVRLYESPARLTRSDLYDRDNGIGRCAQVVKELRARRKK